ncbi:MAG: hypothetical protein AAFX53_19615, partial [Bacteroidota bacterium]
NNASSGIANFINRLTLVFPKQVVLNMYTLPLALILQEGGDFPFPKAKYGYLQLTSSHIFLQSSLQAPSGAPC